MVNGIAPNPPFNVGLPPTPVLPYNVATNAIAPTPSTAYVADAVVINMLDVTDGVVLVEL
jgi:hypothetical protein